MNTALHLAPNVPWIVFALASVILIALGVWAYRFAIPPLPALARRVLPLLRITALVVMLWLLARPVIERPRGAGGTLVVLLDRSGSMELPVAPGGSPRSRVADDAVTRIKHAWHGAVRVLPFATGLGMDSTGAVASGATALGDALEAFGRTADAERASAVVVVGDGAVNAGVDPVEAARGLGLPVHTVLIGATAPPDRAISGLDASARAQVGRVTPVRVHITTTEPRGVALGVQLRDGDRELGRTTVTSPGSGAETVAEFHVTPREPGLAVWTAHVDSLDGEITALNNARGAAVEVEPTRVGVMMLSGGLNWDFTFLRRALAGDSSLALTVWARQGDGWSAPDRARTAAPTAEALHGQTLVVLDALAPREVAPGFDVALRAFVANGGGLIVLGGPPPGVERFRSGAFANDLGFTTDAAVMVPNAAPLPAPEARDLLAWDDDPARGERAWRAAAPLEDPAPIVAGPGDRVLVQSSGKGPPLLVLRHIGRGQVLVVNGTGMWRWSLSGTDELSGERGRKLWRGLVHALAEPIQGEPLRVRPERWLTASGEPVRLFANLQDAAFHPVAGATIEGELRGAGSAPRRIAFVAGTAGSYVAELEGLAPGRYKVGARAVLGGRELGRATAELGVDRFSLEVARTAPDSVTLAAVAAVSGGTMIRADRVGGGLVTRKLSRSRTESLRLWESPWPFALVLGFLSIEWIWRRRRGLP